MNFKRLEDAIMSAPIIFMIFFGLSIFTLAFIYHFGEVSGELYALQLQIRKQEAQK